VRFHIGTSFQLLFILAHLRLTASSGL
jgi:hypothetical protein